MTGPISENKSQSQGRRSGSASAAAPAAGNGTAPLRRITSEELLGDATQIVIDHGGQEYRLCRTRNGKLILVK